MTNENKFLVTDDYRDQRLDLFLSEKLEISRSQAQKMIEQNQVLINEKLPKKAGDKIKEGDVIRVIPRSGATSEPPVSPNKRLSKTKGIATASGLAMTPRIISETPDYVVIEKPTGMLTHPTQADETNTLVNYLVKKYPEIKKVGDLPALPTGQAGGRQVITKVRPGIVHRLDKEASGLLVAARTQKMFNHLKEQFKNRTVEKEYFALAHGKVAKDWDIINFPIARSETSDKMAARPISTVIPSEVRTDEESLSKSHTNRDPSLDARDDKEKNAKTEFLVEKRFINFTLLRVILHTGRMHQIRVHLLAYNHPLVGDPLYKQKKRKSKWDEKLGRLFLHSTKLSFIDLEGNKQNFESPLPKELVDFLKLLK